MKTKTVYFTTTLIIMLLATTIVSYAQTKEAKNKEKTIQLFNGKNLKNWAFHLKDASVDPATTFTVQNGVIHVTGSPFGYMRTKEMYSDYKLHVEWRWPVEATNSGVFVHAHMPDTIWPKCIEAQLSNGNAGDFICNGIDMNERTNKASKVVKKMVASNEKPTGEWNIMEVTCRGNSIEVSVNGVLQNKGTNLTITEGHICLQSEGKDIEFKNVFLTKY
jgi:hypothetical protein